jgi:hypothetical protein
MSRMFGLWLAVALASALTLGTWSGMSAVYRMRLLERSAEPGMEFRT